MSLVLLLALGTEKSPPKVRRRLAGLAMHRKADYSEVPFYTPLDVCLARNAERWADGDTKVPDEAILRMFEQWPDHPGHTA